MTKSNELERGLGSQLTTRYWIEMLGKQDTHAFTLLLVTITSFDIPVFRVMVSSIDGVKLPQSMRKPVSNE